MAKTKALISCAVTAQLICVFVFAYAKSRFSHDEAHIRMVPVAALFVAQHFKANVDLSSLAKTAQLTSFYLPKTV